MEEHAKDVATEAHVTFVLDQETFCVSVNSVVKILEMTDITRVPESPSYMKGIINLRGNILPVVDTRLKLGLENAKHSPKSRILVLDIETPEKTLSIGAIVDLAKEVITVSKEEIMPPPSLEDYERAPYIEGVINHQDHFILILNINKLFAKNEIDAMEHVQD